MTNCCSDVQWHPELLCLLSQLFGNVLHLLESQFVWEVQSCLLGYHGQLLKMGTQLIAHRRHFPAGLLIFSFTTQSVHESLAHHDDQLAVGDELFRGLAIIQAAYKHADGLLNSSKIKPAVVRDGRPPGGLEWTAGLNGLWFGNLLKTQGVVKWFRKSKSMS